MRFFVARDEAASGDGRSAGSRFGEARRPAQGAAAASAATAPLTIRDIDDDVLVEKDHDWASRKPSKRALQLAFYPRRADGEPARGHAEDLRADEPAFRLGRAAEGRVGERDAWTICSTARCARRASSASIRSAISMRRARRRSGELIERARAPQGAGAGRARGRRQAEHWARPETLESRLRARRGDRPHPLSVRSAGHPAQAPRSCSSATSTASRPMCRRRSASSATSRCRCWSATRSSPLLDLKTDRERQKLLMQKWTWIGKGARARAQEADRGGAAPLRALPARAVRRASRQVFSTFQKGTWAGMGMKPLTLARRATGGAHWPSNAIGT